MRAECRCRHSRSLALRTKRTRAVINRGDDVWLRAFPAWRRGLARSTCKFGRGRTVLMIRVRLGDLDFRFIDLNAAQLADQPIGGFGVHMVVRKTESANDRSMLAVLGGPALENDMVELVARDRKRIVATSVRRATRLPRVFADLSRRVPALPESIHDISDGVAHHDVTPHVGSGKRAASFLTQVRCTNKGDSACLLQEKEAYTKELSCKIAIIVAE